MMRKFLVTISAVAFLAGVPAIANADPDAAANAAAGAAVGAAVGAGVGGTVGAGAPRERHYRDEVVIERRERVRERSCYRDSFGNRVCEEYTR